MASLAKLVLEEWGASNNREKIHPQFILLSDFGALIVKLTSENM